MIRTTLHNVVLYKDATLDLSYSGLTTIRGLNKNATSGVRRSNGSGKSLIMQTLPNVLLSSSPTLSHLGKRTSNVSKSMLTAKDSFIEQEFRITDNDVSNHYIVRKRRKGQSAHIDVIKNGKDEGLRTLTLGERYLADLIPWTEEEYYTHQYVDGRRPSTLNIGSPAERLAFLSNVFKLDTYDAVRVGAAEMIKELKDDRVRLDELMEQAADADKMLEEAGDTKALVKKQTRLKDMVKHYKERRKDAQRDRDNLSEYNTHRDLIRRVKAFGPTDTLDEDVRKTYKLLQRTTRYNNYLEALEDYKARTKEARKVVEGYDEKKSRKRLKVEKNNAEKQQGFCTTLQRQLRDHKERRDPEPKDTRKAASKACKALGVKLSKAENRVEEILATARELRSTNLSIIANAKKLKDGQPCFACGSKVKHGHEDVIKALRKAVKKCDAAIEKYTKVLSDVKSAIAWTQWHEENEKSEKELRRITKELTHHETLHAKAVRKVKKLKPIVEAFEDLASSKKPSWEGPVPSASVKDLEERLERLTTMTNDLNAYAKIEDLVKEVQRKYINPAKAYRKAKKTLRKLTREGEGYIAELSKIEPLLENVERMTKQVLGIREKIERTRKRLKDLEVLEMIANAYSNKHLKLQRMQGVAHQLESAMNRYSDLTFHEPIKFNLDLTPTKFDIWAYRSKSKKTGEVRTLSGAESGSFRLLSMWGILTCIPSSRRSNLLVLDEADTGLDTAGRQLYIDSFIPELNTVIPHIVVCTPEDDEYPSSRTYTAVKKGDTTRLVYGGRGHDH